MVIHRFEVPRDDQVHEVPFWGGVLAVNCPNVDLVEFWALDAPGQALAPRRMQVVGTGQPLPAGFRYWGSATPARVDAWQARVVWHLIELDAL